MRSRGKQDATTLASRTVGPPEGVEQLQCADAAVEHTSTTLQGGEEKRGHREPKEEQAREEDATEGIESFREKGFCREQGFLTKPTL